MDPGCLHKNSKKVDERGRMQRFMIERGDPCYLHQLTNVQRQYPSRDEFESECVESPFWLLDTHGSRQSAFLTVSLSHEEKNLDITSRAMAG